MSMTFVTFAYRRIETGSSKKKKMAVYYTSRRVLTSSCNARLSRDRQSDTQKSCRARSRDPASQKAAPSSLVTDRVIGNDNSARAFSLSLIFPVLFAMHRSRVTARIERNELIGSPESSTPTWGYYFIFFSLVVYQNISRWYNILAILIDADVGSQQQDERRQSICRPFLQPSPALSFLFD